MSDALPAQQVPTDAEIPASSNVPTPDVASSEEAPVSSAPPMPPAPPQSKPEHTTGKYIAMSLILGGLCIVVLIGLGSMLSTRMDTGEESRSPFGQTTNEEVYSGSEEGLAYDSGREDGDDSYSGRGERPSSQASLGSAQSVGIQPKMIVKLAENPTPNTPVAKIYRPELELVEEVLLQLKAGKELPHTAAEAGSGSKFLTYQDIDSSKVAAWQARFTKEQQLFQVPKDLEPLFTTEAAFTDIEKILYASRNDFLELLKSYKVDQSLIEEIDKRVLPADKDHLWLSYSDDMYKEFSFVDEVDYTHADRSDMSEAYMRYEMGSAFLSALRVHQSGLLGPEPTNLEDKLNYWRQARDMGMRKVIFHEMTHVLQIAYRNLVATQMTEEDTVNMTMIDWGMEKFFPSAYFWDTKSSMFGEIENYVIAMEGMATMFEQMMIADLYALNPQQAKIHLDYGSSGERVALPTEKMKIIKKLATGTAPYVKDTVFMERYLGYVFDKMPDSEQKDFVKQMLPHVGPNSLASYEGYCVTYDDKSSRQMMAQLQKRPWGRTE